MTEPSKSDLVLLIDTANCRNVDFEQMLRLVQPRGKLGVARAYGNYTNRTRDFDKAAEKLYLLGVQLIHCPAWRTAEGWKSTADETLMNEARTLLSTEKQATQFIIATGDGHFVPIICEIKRQGKKAVVIATQHKISEMLKKAADEFIPLAPVASSIPRDILQALAQAVRRLQRMQSRSAVYPSCLKAKLIEVLGEFDEKQYRDRNNRSFTKFSEFLREAQAQGWVHLIQQNNTLLVTTATERAQAA